MYAMEPVFAMAFGAIWLKEELQWNKLLGAASIVLACILSAI